MSAAAAFLLLVACASVGFAAGVGFGLLQDRAKRRWTKEVLKPRPSTPPPLTYSFLIDAMLVERRVGYRIQQDQGAVVLSSGSFVPQVARSLAGRLLAAADAIDGCKSEMMVDEKKVVWVDPPSAKPPETCEYCSTPATKLGLCGEHLKTHFLPPEGP